MPTDNKQKISQSTHGRISFDNTTGFFNPYRLNSEINWERIHKEKGLRKSVDVTLFQLSKLTQVQTIRDQYLAHTDYKMAYTAYSQEHNQEYWTPYVKLLDDIHHRQMTDRDILTKVAPRAAPFAVLAGILIPMSLYGLGNISLMPYRYMRRGFEAESALARGEFSRNLLERGALPRAIAGECPVCFDDIEEDDRFAVTHCVSHTGEPVPGKGLHVRCLEDWQRRQLQVAADLPPHANNYRHALRRAYGDLLRMPCPLCKKPILTLERLQIAQADAEDLVLARDLRLRRTFPQYVMDKTIHEPMSKLSDALARGGQNMVDLVRGGYRPVPEVELQDLHGD